MLWLKVDAENMKSDLPECFVFAAEVNSVSACPLSVVRKELIESAWAQLIPESSDTKLLASFKFNFSSGDTSPEQWPLLETDCKEEAWLAEDFFGIKALLFMLIPLTPPLI